MEHVDGAKAIAFADQQPRDVHHRHERHDCDVLVHPGGFGEDPELPPAQARSKVRQPRVGGDERGEIEDSASAGYELVVVRAGRLDG